MACYITAYVQMSLANMFPLYDKKKEQIQQEFFFYELVSFWIARSFGTNVEYVAKLRMYDTFAGSPYE